MRIYFLSIRNPCTAPTISRNLAISLSASSSLFSSSWRHILPLCSRLTPKIKACVPPTRSLTNCKRLVSNRWFSLSLSLSLSLSQKTDTLPWEEESQSMSPSFSPSASGVLFLQGKRGREKTRYCEGEKRKEKRNCGLALLLCSETDQGYQEERKKGRKERYLRIVALCRRWCWEEMRRLDLFRRRPKMTQGQGSTGPWAFSCADSRGKSFERI